MYFFFNFDHVLHRPYRDPVVEAEGCEDIAILLCNNDEKGGSNRRKIEAIRFFERFAGGLWQTSSTLTLMTGRPSRGVKSSASLCWQRYYDYITLGVRPFLN